MNLKIKDMDQPFQRSDHGNSQSANFSMLNNALQNGPVFPMADLLQDVFENRADESNKSDSSDSSDDASENMPDSLHEVLLEVKNAFEGWSEELIEWFEAMTSDNN